MVHMFTVQWRSGSKCPILEASLMWNATLNLSVTPHIVFTESSLWANTDIESPCPSVCLSLCVCHRETTTSWCCVDFLSKNVTCDDTISNLSKFQLPSFNRLVKSALHIYTIGITPWSKGCPYIFTGLHLPSGGL